MKFNTLEEKIIFEGAAVVHASWCADQFSKLPNIDIYNPVGYSEGDLLVNGRYEVRNGKVCKFKNGEDILVPYEELSNEAQLENKLAAQSCLSVYIMLKQAGISDEDILNPENSELLGTIIHTDWMKRNDKNNNNSYLFVPYEQLGDWEKEQDLKVFKAVMMAANQNLLEVEVNPDIVIPGLDELRLIEIQTIESKENSEIA